MKSKEYRSRIYKDYVTSRNHSLAPDSSEGFNSRASYLKKLINDHFPKNKEAHILDLGCGHGALLFFAQQVGYINTSGVDVSPEQIEIAKSLGIKDVEHGDILLTLAGCDDNSLDCIVAFDVIEHFTRDELLPFIDEIHRVLKANGIWIIHTVNGQSPFFGTVRYGDITHEMVFSATSLSQLMLSSGFSSLQSFEDGPIPHGGKSMVRAIIWKFFRGLIRFYFSVETGNTWQDGIFTQNFLTVVRK